jgi:hypothetical protein
MCAFFKDDILLLNTNTSMMHMLDLNYNKFKFNLIQLIFLI